MKDKYKGSKAQKELSRIILGTGSYNTVKSGNTVSISGDGGNLCQYNGQSYKALAPRLITYLSYKEKIEALKELKQNLLYYEEYLKQKKKIEFEYIKSFYDLRLKDLDAYILLKQLKKQFGNEIILLCYEPADEFCHRRLVADYIEQQTGIYIPEVSVDAEGKVKELVPIRYIDKLNSLKAYSK